MGICPVLAAGAEHREAAVVDLDAFGHVEVGVAERDERGDARLVAVDLRLPKIDVGVAEANDGETVAAEPPTTRPLDTSERNADQPLRPSPPALRHPCDARLRRQVRRDPL